MIEKPEQYYDTRRHQLYYQWRESEHFSHQEPIYDRTREYIESLESDNDKLRELVKSMYYDLTNMTFPPDWVTDYEADMRELGVDE